MNSDLISAILGLKDTAMLNAVGVHALLFWLSLVVTTWHLLTLPPPHFGVTK